MRTETAVSFSPALSPTCAAHFASRSHWLGMSDKTSPVCPPVPRVWVRGLVLEDVDGIFVVGDEIGGFGQVFVVQRHN